MINYVNYIENGRIDLNEFVEDFGKNKTKGNKLLQVNNTQVWNFKDDI